MTACKLFRFLSHINSLVSQFAVNVIMVRDVNKKYKSDWSFTLKQSTFTHLSYCRNPPEIRHAIDACGSEQVTNEDLLLKLCAQHHYTNKLGTESGLFLLYFVFKNNATQKAKLFPDMPFIVSSALRVKRSLPDVTEWLLQTQRHWRMSHNHITIKLTAVICPTAACQEFPFSALHL